MRQYKKEIVIEKSDTNNIEMLRIFDNTIAIICVKFET